MKCVTIYDYDANSNVLSFDVIDILLAIISYVGNFQWKLESVECVGGFAEEIHKIADQAVLIDTNKFVELAKGVDQTIDGEFYGFQEGCEDPKICIRAVDSSAFDVESDNMDVVAKLKARFSRVDDVD